LGRLRPETGNIRAALGWALDHDPIQAAWLAGSLDAFWNFSNHFAEGRAWTERALATATTMPTHVRARALATAGWLTREQGDMARAHAQLTEAEALARTLGDVRLRGIALNHLGQTAIAQGHIEAAWQIHEEERRCALATGVPLDMAIATLNLGLVAMAKGDLPHAQEYLEEALALHQSSGSALGMAVIRLSLGSVVLARGDQSAAATYFRGAFSLFAERDDQANAARALEGLAGSTISRQPVSATRLLGTAATMRERVGRPRRPREQPSYEQTVAAARRVLGEPTFAAAWEVERFQSWDEVLAEVDVLMDTINGSPDAPPDPAVSHGLTRREREVLQLLVDGRSNRAIAEFLSLSERTVENHVLHILTKLNLDSRTAAATYAVRHGLA